MQTRWRLLRNRCAFKPGDGDFLKDNHLISVQECTRVCCERMRQTRLTAEWFGLDTIIFQSLVPSKCYHHDTSVRSRSVQIVLYSVAAHTIIRSGTQNVQIQLTAYSPRCRAMMCVRSFLYPDSGFKTLIWVRSQNLVVEIPRLRRDTGGWCKYQVRCQPPTKSITIHRVL